MTGVTVATVEDLQDGDRKFLSVDGMEITVLNVEGEFYAIRNSCPHMEGPVGRGRVSFDHEAPCIQCPFHNWTFDLETGNVLSGKKRLRTFDVSIEDGNVVVDV